MAADQGTKTAQAGQQEKCPVMGGKIDPKSHLIPAHSKQESVLYQPVSALAPKIFPVLKKYTDKVKDLMFDEKPEQTGS